jgi:hypothetical protein
MSAFTTMRRILDLSAFVLPFACNFNHVVGADIIAGFAGSTSILVDSNHNSSP